MRCHLPQRITHERRATRTRKALLPSPSCPSAELPAAHGNNRTRARWTLQCRDQARPIRPSGFAANHSRSLSLGQRQRQRRHELTSSADGGPGPWVGRPLPVPRSLTASPPRSHGRLSVPCPRPPATCPRPRPYHANSDGEPRMEYGGRATAHSRSTTPSAIACWVALGLKVNARPARPRPSVAAQGIGARVRSAVNPSPCTATAREHLLPSFPPPPGAVWCSSCVDRHRHVLVEIDSGATATPHPHAWVQQVDVDPRAYGRTDGRTGRGLGVVGHSLAGPLLARRSWRCACPPHSPDRG